MHHRFGNDDCSGSEPTSPADEECDGAGVAEFSHVQHPQVRGTSSASQGLAACGTQARANHLALVDCQFDPSAAPSQQSADAVQGALGSALSTFASAQAISQPWAGTKVRALAEILRQRKEAAYKEHLDLYWATQQLAFEWFTTTFPPSIQERVWTFLGRIDALILKERETDMQNPEFPRISVLGRAKYSEELAALWEQPCSDL